MTDRGLYRRRRVVVALALMLGFSLIVCRLVHLQVMQAAELRQKADRQHQKSVAVEGPRGTIYDRRGKMLAVTMDVPSLFAVPSSLEDPAGMAHYFAKVLHAPIDELEHKLRQDRQFVWVARKLDPEQWRRLENLSVGGVGMVLEGRRYYPNGPLLSHVLGFVGMDGQGLEGIEHRYDPLLRGQKHMLVLQRDALGRIVFPTGPGGKRATPGRNLTLTIDEFIQYIAEKELEEGVKNARAKSGMAILMDPRSGAILAMALNPKFDSNDLRTASADRWRNRILTDAYEPGSTLKIIIAAAALQEKAMRPETLVFGEHGRMDIARTVIHDHARSGWMTFAQAIQRSSNIGTIKAAMALGRDGLYRYLKVFGFGERTEVDLPGETAGIIRPPHEWGRRSLASIAIGQEVGVTALQLVTAVSAVANGGWLMRPYVVSEIRDADRREIARIDPQVRGRPISAKTAHELTGILEGVVTAGTGSRAAVPGYRVAGKTGTAQKIDPRTGRYSPTLFVGSFAGYVPAEDPRLAMVIVIDEPQTNAWGGVVAAPVFKRIAEQVLPYLGVPPSDATQLVSTSRQRTDPTL